MPIPPPPTPIERFATILRCLSLAVAARTGWGLPLLTIAQIVHRLRRIRQRFVHLAARVQAGTYAPRRRSSAQGRPVPPDKLPRKPGWLLKLMPEAVGYRAHLESLFQEAEMAALLAAAPGPMRRALRSLCRMLAIPLPPILAPPPPAPKPAAPAAKPQKPPPPRHNPPSPPSRTATAPTPRPLPRACGPPRPA